jgi:hypothetical protein
MQRLMQVADDVEHPDQVERAQGVGGARSVRRGKDAHLSQRIANANEIAATSRMTESPNSLNVPARARRCRSKAAAQ